MDKQALLGEHILSTLSSGAGLRAGTGARGKITVAAPETMAQQQRVRKIMTGAYRMAERAKKAEADKIRKTLFGDTGGSANPISKTVADWLALQTYKRDIEPFLKSMEHRMMQLGVGSNKVPVPVQKKRSRGQASLLKSFLTDIGYRVGPGGKIHGRAEYPTNDMAKWQRDLKRKATAMEQ